MQLGPTPMVYNICPFKNQACQFFCHQFWDILSSCPGDSTNSTKKQGDKQWNI